MPKLKDLLPFLCIGLISLIFYLPSLKYGFSQDDFIHIFDSRAENIFGVLNFFNPFAHFKDIFFYRPFTTQLYFYINGQFLGNSPYFMHIQILILHLINTYLFYKVVKILWPQKIIALLSSFLYGISAIHFLSIYYIAAFQQMGLTFFMLLSTHLFTNSLSKKGFTLYLGSILSFIGALFCKEAAIIFPLYLVVFELFAHKAENLKRTIPFFLVGSIYLILRAYGIKSIFDEGSYSGSFSLMNALQNLKWYVLWSFGLPEILSTYPTLNPKGIAQFIRDFGHSFYIIISFVILVCTLIFSMFSVKQLSRKVLFYSLSLFLIPLAPALFLIGHKYPQYLDFSMLGFLPLLSLILLSRKRARILILGVGGLSFVFLQYFSLSLSEQTHWTTHRAKVAAIYQQELTKDSSFIEKGAVVVFIGSDEQRREVSIALAKDYALRDWFGKGVGEVLYLKDPSEIKQQDKALIKYISVY